jgi:hypothetical protein
MKFSDALRLALVFEAALLPAQAFAAPQSVDTLSVFDERDYAWPGSSADGKTVIDSITVNPGYAESPIRPFGDCAYIDNQGDPFTLSFKTKEEWDSFKKTHPASVALHACCPHEVVQNPCNGNTKILGAGRAGAFATLAFSPSYVHVYQCEATGDALAAWKLVGENTIGGCPPANTVFPDIKAAPCASFLPDKQEETFPDGTGIIVPGQTCRRNYVCLNGSWQQTNWWSDNDVVRRTGAASCY